MKRIKAIVYTSHAGHTEAYARMLGKEFDLPVYALGEAGQYLEKGTPIIYFGWLRAGIVQGLKEALKTYDLKAAVGVGMQADRKQLEDVRKANPFPDDVKVFTVQGGLEIDKLKGIYKWMMKTMSASMIRKLKKEADRTPQEEEKLKMFTEGLDLVSAEHLREVIRWTGKQL